MTNHADGEEILMDKKIEKVTEFKYLGQNTKEEIYARARIHEGPLSLLKGPYALIVR